MTVFTHILDMSRAAAIVIVFVLLARLVLRKAPKVFSYALWAVVLFRLLCPLTIEAPVSVVPDMTPVAEYYAPVEPPAVSVPPVEQPAVTPPPVQTMPEAPQTPPAPVSQKVDWLAVGQYAWLTGVAAMAVWSAVSYLRLRRRLVGAMPLRDNIYLADHIDSPFVMGLLRPKIYLPSSLTEQEQTHIILHEQHHIRRGDHLIKALAFLALCIHWFNPLVWLAFVLSSKDMEMSCDEAVVKKLGADIRADYSASLLSLATGRRIIAGTPLAFGEGDTKSRIRNMLSWKRAKPAVVFLAAAAVILVTIVCVGNSKEDTPADKVRWEAEEDHPEGVVTIAKDYVARQIEEYNNLGSGETAIAGEYSITDAKIVGLSRMATAPYDETRHVGIYLLEYRLLPDQPDHVVLAGGMQMEDGWITEWGSVGQPYLVILCDTTTGKEIWTYIGSTNADSIQFDYGTEEMVERYGDQYIAAAMQIYGKYLSDHGGDMAVGVGAYGTADDVAYYLELAAGGEFIPLEDSRKEELLAEYGDLLEGYTLTARRSGDTAYILGQYSGDPTHSSLYLKHSIELDETWQVIFPQSLEAAVQNDPLGAEGAVRVEKSRALWSENSSVVLIQPKDSALMLDVPFNRYFHTPNGRAYMEDAAARGIDLCGRTDTYLYVYRITEEFGELSERIALTEAEARAILAEERVRITEGFGFSATLHIDGQTTYYNEREGVPQTVLDMAVEMCDYRFGDPSYITDDIAEATLTGSWLDTDLHADPADLPRLKEILQNAEQGYVGACGYGAVLKLTFAGGEKLTVFKGCDGCDTIVFGSYGGYFLGEQENREFWEMFGIDPDTRTLMEENPAGNSERTAVFSNGEITITVPAEYADLIRVDSLYSDNMFTTAANLYYAPAYSEHEGYAASLNGGWLMTVCDTSYTSAVSMAGDESEETRVGRWRRDGRRVYVEFHTVEDNCSADQREEFRAVLASVQVHYDGLTPFDAERAGAVTNAPFSARALDGQSPLNGMFERTYEAQLHLMQTDFERTSPLFLAKQTLEFDTCAVLLGETPANDAGEMQGAAYILFRDGAMNRLPLPVDADGRDVCPAAVRQSGADALVYTVGSGNSTCNYTVNLTDRTVSMTVGAAAGAAITPAAPPADAVVRRALDDKHTETMLQTYGGGAPADFITCAFVHLAQEWEDETTYTFYTDVLHAAYRFKDGKYDRVDAVSVPTKLTFNFDGTWHLSERWTPGSTDSVGTVFPAEALEILERTGPEYYDPRTAECDDNAIRHYVAQTGVVPSKTFTPADVEFTGQALGVVRDEMTYEERLAWVQAEPEYGSLAKISLGQYAEGEGCLAYTGQWVGTPHMDQYTFDIRFADGTTANLPLPRSGWWGSALPDTMKFEGGKFVYETVFRDELLESEGQTLIHLKGIYRYEVDLAAKTVSLRVIQ